MMPAIYGNQYQIVQAPGYVAILYEMIHETRVIPLDPSRASGSSRAESRDDNRVHVDSKIRLDMGDARGRWDGDTLVVTTKNFKERSVYRNANAETLTLTERFQRIAPDKVRWTSDGRLITAGMLDDEPACGGPPKDEKGIMCARGYVAVTIDPKTMAVTELARGPATPSFTGTAIAMRVGNELWLGSFNANRLAYRALK
jgi:hypothetical protein